MHPSLPSGMNASQEESKRKAHSQVLKPKAAPFAPKMFHRQPLSLASPAAYFSSIENPAVQKIVHYYKTSLCPELKSRGCSKGESCFYYHSAEDRRRPIFLGDLMAYSSQFCPVLASGGICSNGDACYYSHTRFESLFHPQTYKTNLCPENCQKPYCPFVHSSIELRKHENLVMYSIMGEGLMPPVIRPNMSPFGVSQPAAYVPTKKVFSPIKEYSKGLMGQALGLDAFKTKPCPYTHAHNQKRCIYYHSLSDRRRVPVFYSCERCSLSKHCPLEDTCQKSHSIVEQLYHPDKYKKKMCHEYPDRLKDCEYGEFCCFAHSESELNIELIHEYEKDQNFYMIYFKTERCPFNHDHNKSICVYAHNWQDYRRRPTMPYPQYSPKLCPDWDTNKFINEYMEGCPMGFKCMYSHGWKEYLFHPYSYKTLPCQDIAKCHQGPDCPYFHGEFDRRYPDTGVYTRTAPGYDSWMGIVKMIPKDFETRRKFSEIMTSSTSGVGSEGEGAIDPNESMSPNIPLPSGWIRLAPHKEKIETQPSLPASEEPSLSSMFPLSEFSSLKIANEYEGIELAQLLEDKKGADGSSTTTEEEKKRSTMDEKIKQEEEEKNGSKSCPSSPLVPQKKYGKVRVLKSLHLDNSEDDDEDDSGKVKLRKLMDWVGLGELSEKLLDAGYNYYDLLVDTETKCRSAGITDNSQIEAVVDRVQSILSRPAGADSPGVGIGEEQCENVVIESPPQKAKVVVQPFLHKASDYFKK